MICNSDRCRRTRSQRSIGGRANTVALDSQSVITRISQLNYTKLELWIEEELQRLSEPVASLASRVNVGQGHNVRWGTRRQIGWRERQDGRDLGCRAPEIAISVGTKQAFTIHSKPVHIKWDKDSLMALPNIYNNRPRTLGGGDGGRNVERPGVGRVVPRSGNLPPALRRNSHSFVDTCI